jgi:hypothetical protein
MGRTRRRLIGSLPGADHQAMDELDIEKQPVTDADKDA